MVSSSRCLGSHQERKTRTACGIGSSKKNVRHLDEDNDEEHKHEKCLQKRSRFWRRNQPPEKLKQQCRTKFTRPLKVGRSLGEGLYEFVGWGISGERRVSGMIVEGQHTHLTIMSTAFTACRSVTAVASSLPNFCVSIYHLPDISCVCDPNLATSLTELLVQFITMVQAM